MLLNAFTMNCVGHIHQGLWARRDTKQREYTSLEPWLELAKLCERGRFDAVFLADVIGLYDTFKGSADTSLQRAMQVPANDPMLLIPAMATATEHLGFAFTSSVLQAHPFTFARQLSTLDHITGGRVGWNVVTSYLPNAARNLGFDDLPPHDERYERAEEYLAVCYALTEGSWADDAVVADRARGIYTDPARVRPINHSGRFYDVEGPHLAEPSPQRMPVLFQAGSSERGRDFAATHAECAFIVSSSRGGGAIAADIRARTAGFGRHPNHIKVFAGVSPVVGGTEAEANAKADELFAQLSLEAGLAHLSGNLGVDLSSIDKDRPLESLRTQGVRGPVKSLLDSAPPGTRTFGDLVKLNMTGQFMVGTPTQIADRLQRRYEDGVDGFNLVYATTPTTFVDFIDAVVPILNERGLVQRDYAPGTFREKLFGYARLPPSHPAHRFRSWA